MRVMGSGANARLVEVIKGRVLAGPVLFPRLEVLPPIARPFSVDENAKAMAQAREWNIEKLEESAPISVIGTGPTLNQDIENGLTRAANPIRMTVPKVRNRATINGAIEIGRAPGVIQVTFLAALRIGRRGDQQVRARATRLARAAWVPAH